MSEHLEVTVRSNIGALNASVVHEALVETVDEAMVGAERFLRADRAMHTRSGDTEAHIRREHAAGTVVDVESKLGITRVTEKDERGRATHGRYSHSSAPIFVDQGTRSPIFAARPGGVMENRSDGIFHRRSVKGQPAQRFMAKTYAEAQALLRTVDVLGPALAAMSVLAESEMTDR
jgi:hypothetical protein